MPKRKASDGDKKLVLDFGTVNPKQQQFLDSRTFYTCYGGARGGGKSHVVRLKGVGMAIHYPGIRILMVRCHYNELKENLINPIIRWLPGEIFSYNGADHLLTFSNGSTIKFGHWDGDNAEKEYQGIEYDVIFVDEATQISERAFNYLATDIRGVNDFPKRMYLTCNPGGIGHNWVKRLFIDRNYRHDPDDPESWERPEDYTFIFATVEDNTYLMDGSPMYLKQLASLPDDLKRAYRYGDWDAIGGNYFKGFSPRTHAHAPFPIPKGWQIYRSFDYGLDMLACIWWAIDTDGRAWAFREYEKSGLIVQDAARAITENSLSEEQVVVTFAPPDMWNRQKETGKTMADIFMMSGVTINKSDNNRIQGHMIMRNMMAPIPLHDKDVINLYPAGEAPEMLPGLMFFSNLQSVMSDIRDIQAAEDNPNDCAKQPHEVTHTVDAVRYFCINRTVQQEVETHRKRFRRSFDDEDEYTEAYGDFMCGGEPTKGYMNA